MIEVAVGEHNKIQFPQVDPHLLCIGQEQTRVTGVEQDFCYLQYQAGTSPGSPVKYRSVRVLLSTRTVRLSRGVTDENITGEGISLKASTKMRQVHRKTGRITLKM